MPSRQNERTEIAMSTAYVVTLSEEQLASYRTEGYLLVRGAVPPEILEEGWALYEPWLDSIVDEWLAEGLITAKPSGGPVGERFYEAWKEAGRPVFRRRPFRHLINEAAYRFLVRPVFLDLATQLLGTPEISMHGVYNGRAQPPGCEWARPPFHQDAHFWNSDVGLADAEPDKHVVTMWFPLQPVDARSGCLQLISQADCGHGMFPRVKDDYDETSYVGMRPQDAENYPHRPMPMSPGDILLFTQKTPHAVMPNEADHVRYSYDLRYEATGDATAVGAKYGFVARSLADPSSVTPAAEWVKKRDAYLAWFEKTGGKK